MGLEITVQRPGLAQQAQTRIEGLALQSSKAYQEREFTLFHYFIRKIIV